MSATHPCDACGDAIKTGLIRLCLCDECTRKLNRIRPPPKEDLLFDAVLILAGLVRAGWGTLAGIEMSRVRAEGLIDVRIDGTPQDCEELRELLREFVPVNAGLIVRRREE